MARDEKDDKSKKVAKKPTTHDTGGHRRPTADPGHGTRRGALPPTQTGGKKTGRRHDPKNIANRGDTPKTVKQVAQKPGKHRKDKK